MSPAYLADLQTIPSFYVLKYEDYLPHRELIGLQRLFYPKVQGKVKEILHADDSRELKDLVASKVKTKNDANSNVFSASEMLKSICQHDSVECATLLLEGKTNLSVEINSALEDGVFPLHLAAISLSPRVTELFLHHGAQTDVQCYNDILSYSETSPLNLALEALCFHHCVSDWTPSKSIFKLIYIFCLPEMIEPLKTIKLLASDMRLVQKIGALCVQEGKLVQLAALLMVSWDMFVVPGTHGDGDNSSIGKHVLRELQTVLHQESSFICSGDSGLLQQVRRKKGALLFASSMLEMFRVAGAALTEYRLFAKAKDVPNSEVALDVSSLLRGLGFCLKSNDVDVNDIKCLSCEVKTKQSDLAIGSTNEVRQIEVQKASDKIKDVVRFPVSYPSQLRFKAPRSFCSSVIMEKGDINLVAKQFGSANWSNDSVIQSLKLTPLGSRSLVSHVYHPGKWGLIASATMRWAKYI